MGSNELMENDQVDITHLIRSIQRLEKNPDCFGVAEIQNHCDCMNCAWRKPCAWKNRKIIELMKLLKMKLPAAELRGILLINNEFRGICYGTQF